MAKPEQLVIDYLKRQLKMYADAHNMIVFVDKPPSSVRGAAGRPDLYVDLGPFHLRLEVKSDNGKLSPLQRYYFKRSAHHNDLMCHIIIGKTGVDQFMAGLSTLIDSIIERQQEDAEKWHSTTYNP